MRCRFVPWVLCTAVALWLGFGMPRGVAAQGSEGTETPQSATPDDRHAEALERFDRAAALFERGDPRGALAEMQSVYDLLEGRADQYIVLYNFGRIYEALHRYDRASELYRRYLAESPPDAPDRADAEAALRVLERLLGTLVVRVNVPVDVWMGPDWVGRAPGELRLPAGVASLELRAEGYAVVRREVSVRAGSRTEIDETLVRLGDLRGISPAFALTGAALGLVALGVGAGLGIHALSMRGSVAGCATDDACGDPSALSRALRETALAADIAFGATAVCWATALALAFVTDWRGDAQAGSAAATLPMRFSAGVGPTGGILSLEGSF